MRIEFDLDEAGNPVRVRIDGHDVSNRCTALQIQAGVREPLAVTLTLQPNLVVYLNGTEAVQD